MTDSLDLERSSPVPRPPRDALRHGRLVAKRDAILAVAPDPTPTPPPRPHRRDPAPPAGQVTQGFDEGRRPLPRPPRRHGAPRARYRQCNLARLERHLAGSGRPGKERRAWRPKLAAATRAVTDLTGPELALTREGHRLQKRLTGIDLGR